MAVRAANSMGQRALAVVALAGSMAACGGDDEDTADFCERYRTYEDRNEEVAEEFQEAPDEAGLEDAKRVFSDLASQTEDLAGEAPDDVPEVDEAGQRVNDWIEDNCDSDGAK